LTPSSGQTGRAQRHVIAPFISYLRSYDMMFQIINSFLEKMHRHFLQMKGFLAYYWI